MGPPTGVSVGKPLSGFRGVLTGVPSYVGNAEALVSGKTRSGEMG
jgi:hypothetical protein